MVLQRNFMMALLCCVFPCAAIAEEHPATINFDGLQLAWVKLPAKGEAEQPAKKPAPKPVTKPASEPVIAPVKPVPLRPVAPPPVTTTPVAPKSVQPVTPLTVIQGQSRPQPAAQPKPAATSPQPPAKPASKPGYMKKNVPENEWVLSAGYETGGEELGVAVYADGSTAPVYANAGFVFRAGRIFSNGTDSDLFTHVSLGYKSGGPRLWSSEVNWSAIPIEVIEQYKLGDFRVGLGLNYQLNTQYKVSLPAASFNNRYDNALGLIFQTAWMPHKQDYGIEFRYTMIRFRQSDLPDPPLINGSVAGLSWLYRF